MELAVKPGVGLGRCRCYDRPRAEGLEGVEFKAQQAYMYMYKMYKQRVVQDYMSKYSIFLQIHRLVG